MESMENEKEDSEKERYINLIGETLRRINRLDVLIYANRLFENIEKAGN